MELSTPATWMEKYLELVHRFSVDVIGLPIPAQPTRLEDNRKDWALTALREELREFELGNVLEDEVDALLDLAYFAFGRLIEMGIVPGAAFEEVHAANMGKVRGELSKRPNSKGFDAIKPEGWLPPALLPYLSLDRRQVRAAYEAALSEREATEAAQTPDNEPKETGKPKLLVLGYARHGKDTVAEILQEEYGYKFTSSSMFCAEKVIWEALQNPNAALQRHLDSGEPGMSAKLLWEELEMMINQRYANAEACFKDRSNFRTAWFSLIAAYNYPEKERLAREIFAENDVYVGIRNKREYYSIVNSGMVDIVIWVDADQRCEVEFHGSCTVEPWMSNWIIDNNGTEDELHRNVHQLMSYLGIERNT